MEMRSYWLHALVDSALHQEKIFSIQFQSIAQRYTQKLLFVQIGKVEMASPPPSIA